MEQNTNFDFQFNFKFNLHKSLIPIGISDKDYERLIKVYGIDEKTLMREVKVIEKSNLCQAQWVKEKVDLTPFGTAVSKRILFLGDSITSDRQSYFNILQLACGEYTEISLVDLSISGHKSGDLFTAMFPNVHEEHADIAHIMIGTNDVRKTNDAYHAFHTGIEEYEKNIDYVAAMLAEDGTKTVITTIPPFSQDKAAAYFPKHKMLFEEKDRQAFNDVIRRVGGKHGALINDMDEVYSSYSPEDLTLMDGIHLNEVGQRLLAARVAQMLIKLF